MRVTVTPIGSASRGTDAVAGSVADYLVGDRSSVGHGLMDETGPEGPGAYYADSLEGPGHWTGAARGVLGLDGEVEREAFERVLAGRHPVTGERLISARGSAGRKHLAAGTPARWNKDGVALYEPADVGALLGRSRREVAALLKAGEEHGAAADDGTAGWLASVIVDGKRYVPAPELDRLSELLERGVDADAVLKSGPGDETLTLAQAARLAGLERAYLLRCARTFDEHRNAIASGEPPPRAWLAGRRDETKVKRPWLVTRAELAEFLHRRRPPAVRLGFDVTVTTEKSVAILAMLSDDATRGRALGAIDAANAAAIAHLDRRAALTRDRGNVVLTEGLVVATFLHGTSRAGDPHPHRHNIVANATVDAKGTRRALDARGLYRHAASAAALATAEMRYRLTADLGLRWRRRPGGGWEVKGISDNVIDEFSTRHREIEDALTELAEREGLTPTYGQEHAIALATRAPKAATTPEQLLADWRARAHHHGLDSNALAACQGRSIGPTRMTPKVRSELFKHLSGIDGVTRERSIFDRSTVLAAIVDWESPNGEPLTVPAAKVEELADYFLASQLVVPLDIPGMTDGPGAEPLFSTLEMLELQDEILTRVHLGQTAGMGVADHTITEEVLAEAALSDEQAGMVRSLCQSGDAVGCGIGRAGSGKTTAMAAAARAWERSGYRVVGASVKGEAARLLGEEAAIKSETLAWYLTQEHEFPGPLDSRTVLIVDEASTVSDRDLHRLMTMADRGGAAMRLLGDPAQHSAVTAGGSFSALTEAIQSPELRASHRVRDPLERQAGESVRAGHISEALNSLRIAGRLRELDGLGPATAAMVEHWLDAQRRGAIHPMIDRRNTTRRALNRVAHRLLQADGIVATDGLVATDDREFCVGDLVITRRGDRLLHLPGQPDRWIRNGCAGTVTSTAAGQTPDHDTIEVTFNGIGAITVPRSFFDAHRFPDGRVDAGLDHGYAVTSYAVQGATFDESTSAITPSSSAAELYVDITRGRLANTVFLTRSQDHDSAEQHLPTLPAPAIADHVAAALGRPGERAALDRDPFALESARRSFSRTLTELLADAAKGDTHAARAAQITAQRIATAAVHQPPVGFPRRPQVPWLAAKWDSAVAAVAIHRAKYTTNSSSTDGPLGWLLGATSASPAAVESRVRITAQVAELLAEMVTRHIESANKAQRAALETSIREHVEHALTRGPLDLDATANLHRQPVRSPLRQSQDAAAICR